MEKAEVLNKCFASFYTGGQVSYLCQNPEIRGEGERSGFHPTVTVEQVLDCLMKLDVYKSMGPDGIQGAERDG